MRYRGRSGTSPGPPRTNGDHKREPVTAKPAETLEVKLHPGLYQAAEQAKMDGLCRTWHLLRHLDPGGTGCVAEPAFESFVRDHGLAGFSNLRRLWRQRGADLFWNIRVDRDGVKWIRYRSLARVVDGLTARVDCRVSPLTQPVSVPLTELSRLVQWRARAYAPACYGKPTGKRPKPISRAALRERSGRSTPTQIRYEAEVGVRVTRNYAVLATQSDLAFEPGDEVLDYHCFVRREPDGSYSLCRSLPNTYTLPEQFQFANWGVVKHLRRELQSASLTVDHGAARRYYHDPREALKRDRSREAFLFKSAVQTGERCTARWTLLPCAP